MLSCHLLPPIEFVSKRVPADYPKAFNHIGDHLKAVRLERALTQATAASQMSTNAWTLRNWESATTTPQIKHWPAIIKFLNYCPYQPCEALREKAAMWRKVEGLDTRQLSKLLKVDQRTYLNFEAGKKPILGIYDTLAKNIAALLEGPPTQSNGA